MKNAHTASKSSLFTFKVASKIQKNVPFNLFQTRLRTMKNYQQVLQQVGIVWIEFGVIDIFYLLYCLANGKSYSPGWQVLAIAVGVLLPRENLKVARWTGDAAAFCWLVFWDFF